MGNISPYVGADVAYVSTRPGNFDVGYQTLTGQRVLLPAYTTGSLRAGAKFGGFDLSVYVKNIGNSRGLASVGPLGIRPGNTVAAAPIVPRTIGAALSYAF
jgi:hypothetical protein